jgi:hypothetical protein
LNFQNLEKSKTPFSKPIVPAPLTLIKPFNLSSNSSKMLMKKRMVNSNNDELNQRISETMKRKAGENLMGDRIKLVKTPTNVKYMKRTDRSRSKSPVSKLDEDMQTLSSRIEKYCVISKQNIIKDRNPDRGDRSKTKSKSPLKRLSFNNDRNDNSILFNNNIENIRNSSNTSHSIRRQFSIDESTEDKTLKEMNKYKFKAKPLKKSIFTPQIETFEQVLMKTRQEKLEIEKKEKEKLRFNKVQDIKKQSLRRTIIGGKENNKNLMNKSSNESGLMLVE